MDSDKESISIQIKKVFEENVLSDLKRFMEKRQCLNQTNMVLIYLFHIVQSAGILTTTIATGYNVREYIWIGVGLNVLASLINAFEQTNNNISKKLLQDIQSIKDGKYVDEGIAVESKKSSKKTSNTNVNTTNTTSHHYNEPLLDDNSEDSTNTI
jgi:hypothetical protein